jgi:MFS family permease
MPVLSESRTPGALTEAPRLPAWSWVPLAVAALAMVATLPGRTHGLGLVTEPLLAELRLDRLDFAAVNLWATLLGAAFCLPCGWLIDRLGARAVLAGVTLALGGVVVLMSRVEPARPYAGSLPLLPVLFVLILLTRGLGQSALSVVSLALMGRAVGRRAGLAVGAYSAAVAVGFMGAFALVKFALEELRFDWRALWAALGVAVVTFGGLAWLVLRPGLLAPASYGAGRDATAPASGLTLGRTLRAPAFWVLALATSLYGLIASGVSLFNQSILQERGFDRNVFLTVVTLSPLVGLAGNLGMGWLAARWAHTRGLAVALLGLAGALLAFPLVETLEQVYLYAVVMGFAGGMVTVVFFGAWGRVFGTAHLGQIQGAAQMLTVLASAVGPLLFAAGQRWTGSYVPVFQALAVAAALFALASWWVPLPRLPSASPAPATGVAE